MNISSVDKQRYEDIRSKLARAQIEFGDNIRIQEAYELCNEGIAAHTNPVIAMLVDMGSQNACFSACLESWCGVRNGSESLCRACKNRKRLIYKHFPADADAIWKASQ